MAAGRKDLWSRSSLHTEVQQSRAEATQALCSVVQEVGRDATSEKMTNSINLTFFFFIFSTIYIVDTEAVIHVCSNVVLVASMRNCNVNSRIKSIVHVRTLDR